MKKIVFFIAIAGLFVGFADCLAADAPTPTTTRPTIRHGIKRMKKAAAGQKGTKKADDKSTDTQH